jgi:hypothetical protein
VDLEDLKKLRSRAAEVLRALDMPCRNAARAALDRSLAVVPRGGAPDDATDLADTAFIGVPVHDLGPVLSTNTSAGYEHPAAGAIEEGFHFGKQTRNPPPSFLRKSVRGLIRSFRQDVATTLAHVLKRLFPKR